MKFQSVDQYLNTLENELQNKLKTLRSTILSVDPKIVEYISYNMPAYKINKSLIYFFVFKHHIGIFPHQTAIETFSNELKPYKTSKGAIQIPLDQEIPLALIKKMVVFNINLYVKNGL